MFPVLMVGALLELPVNPDTTDTQVRDIVEDSGGHVDGATGTARALVHDLSSGSAAVRTDGYPSAAHGGVVGVRVVPVLRGRQSNHGVIVAVESAAGTKSLFRLKSAQYS